jgi:hypothetical protein
MEDSNERAARHQPNLLPAAVTALLTAIVLNAQATPDEVRDIAQRAYIYAYPLVLLEATRGEMPVNRFTHVPQFPRPDSRQVIRPNADTLYSTAWLDVSREPVLIYVPDSGGRFYLLQFMDACPKPSRTRANVLPEPESIGSQS